MLSKYRHKTRKDQTMFHPHFLDLFFDNPHSMADTMQLISAFKVEQDLQDKWREEREMEERNRLNAIPERARGKREK